MKKIMNTALLTAGIVASPMFGNNARACDQRVKVPAASYSYHTVHYHTVAATPVVIQPVATVTKTVEVKAAVPAEVLPQINPGVTVAVRVNFLGTTPGYAVIEVGGTAHQAEILSWEPSKVRLKLPTFSVNGKLNARLSILKSDGSLARSLDFELVNPPGFIVESGPDDLEVQTISARTEIQPAPSIAAGLLR